MSTLELLETSEDTTLARFVADVISAADVTPDCFDNRPTWDNWSNKR
ncbi:hypothetical protein [Thermomonospora umbrina]|uniref:Uncharacterized protein n=1 Tax=Thermomonospora umbrina TaxID=111806 RepID=A0A3D9T1H9_9ACTN|nr:hypothetical protein [Thermomonospora umbrina]REE97681.1 hypothetical protein DFJ69_3155 [Thermomonospora umbrina]